MKTQKLNNILDKILNISGFILILSLILTLLGFGKIFFPIMWIALFLILISSNIKCGIDKEYRKRVENGEKKSKSFVFKTKILERNKKPIFLRNPRLPSRSVKSFR